MEDTEAGEEHMRLKQAQKVKLMARQARAILNSGYSTGGASTSKTSMRGWDWRGGSPTEDIHANLDVLRQRSRDLFMHGGMARAAVNRLKDNSVGIGLRLRATPDRELLGTLGLSEEEIAVQARAMQREFELWAGSREASKEGLDTFYELQGLAAVSWPISGDCFALLPMVRSEIPGWPFELRVHLIEADRVRNAGGWLSPTAMPLSGGGKVECGVEMDVLGRVVAYHVAAEHPLSRKLGAALGDTARVPVRDVVTGRLNILHMLTRERPEQTRGLPYVSPVIERLKQLSRYNETELMAAVVASLFTVFVKSQNPTNPFGESLPIEQKVTSGASDEDYHYELGPGIVQTLGLNEDISTATPGRPNAAYEAFVRAAATEIGAALNLPGEVILQRFEASYSASRAALLEAWKTFKGWRHGLIQNLCYPVYEELMWEAVLKARLDLPGFLDDAGIRQAWLRSEWHGPSMGQIDPLKEVTAAGMRIELGISTGAREAMELTGSDYDENIVRRGEEEAAREEAGLPPTGTDMPDAVIAEALASGQ